MGCEWKRLLGRSAIYLLLVAAFPLLLLLTLLLKGRWQVDILEIAVYFFVQGWGIVTVVLAVDLASRAFQREHGGAWEYLASLPRFGLWILWKKVQPRLAILLIWMVLFRVLQGLPILRPALIEEMGIPRLFTHPAQLLICALYFFLPAFLLSIMAEAEDRKRQFLAWFGMISLYLWVWILSTLFAPGGFRLFTLSKASMLELFSYPGVYRFGLFALLGILPLFWVAWRSFRGFDLQTPHRFVSGFLKICLPFYALSWIWLAGALFTGGIA